MKAIFHGFSIMGAFAFLVLAAGCASTQQTENSLSAAGFMTVVATASQLQLRPYKVTVTEQSGKTPYTYADPAHNQIYIGDQSQY
jgi:hypothetical protein